MKSPRFRFFPRNFHVLRFAFYVLRATNPRLNFSDVKFNRGFVALISVAIISLVLLFVVIAVGEKGIVSRYMLLDLERKTSSENLANACVQTALIEIANDPNYTVLTTAPIEVPVGTEKCTIHSVSPDTPIGSGRSTIKTFAAVSGATTNLKIEVISSSAIIHSKKECPTLSLCP